MWDFCKNISNQQGLLVGMSIGGVGALVASLVSLITLRKYTKHNPVKSKYYIEK